MTQEAGDGHHYGLATPADAMALSGLELLRAIVDGRLPQAPISRTLHFWIVEAGEGRVVFEGEPSPDLFNPMGTVHGGWALTLMDSASGAAGHSTLPPGAAYVTLETKGHLVRPITASTGRVRVDGRVITRGRKVMTSEASVTAADGKVLAHGTSTLLVIPPRATSGG